LLGGSVLAQYGLGVITLLLAVPAGVAVMHQIGATILLTSVLLIAHALRYVPAAYPHPGHDSNHDRGHGQTARGTPFYGSTTPSTAPRSTGQSLTAPGSAAEDPTP